MTSMLFVLKKTHFNIPNFGQYNIKWSKEKQKKIFFDCYLWKKVKFGEISFDFIVQQILEITPEQ